MEIIETRSVAITATMKNLKVGDSIVIPNKKAKSNALRATASKLKALKMEFRVTEKGQKDSTIVIRLK